MKTGSSSYSYRTSLMLALLTYGDYLPSGPMPFTRPPSSDLKCWDSNRMTKFYRARIKSCKVSWRSRKASLTNSKFRERSFWPSIRSIRNSNFGRLKSRTRKHFSKRSRASTLMLRTKRKSRTILKVVRTLLNRVSKCSCPELIFCPKFSVCHEFSLCLRALKCSAKRPTFLL